MQCVIAPVLRAAAALLVTIAVSVHAQPVLFHDHGHGLAYSQDGKRLFAPSEAGLAIYSGGSWSDAPAQGETGPIQAFSGFSITAGAVYSSGYSEGASSRVPSGLLHSTDGGIRWRTLALSGEADFRLLAAGYRTNAIYVLNIRPNSAMPRAGLYVTHDQGKTWRQAALRGLKGEIHGLSAHPGQPATVAVATGNGLYLSRDEGESVVSVDTKRAVTGVAFDVHGDRLRYAYTLANQIVDVDLTNRKRRSLVLPALKGDYVTCLAQNPVDGQVFAFATRRKEVFLTRDGGKSWQRITNGT